MSVEKSASELMELSTRLVSHRKEGEPIYGSVLREMQGQERNERCHACNHEERQAGNSGRLPGVRD